MLRRIIFITLTALILCGFIRGGSTYLLTFTPAWQNLRVGAGGNMAYVNAYADGTIVGRGDTFGGWVYSPSTNCTIGGSTLTAPCWQNTVTVTSLNGYWTSSNSGNGNYGAAAIEACPSNTNVIYASFDRKLFVSTNKGTTWNVVGTPQLTTGLDSNGGGTTSARANIACNPTNPDIAIVGTKSDKVYKITNGTSGASATYAALPAPVVSTGSNAAGSAYEIGSSTHLITCVYGTGCYESTNGGTSFSSIISGGPTNVEYIIGDKYAQFWAVVEASTLYKYTTGGGWVVADNTHQPTSVAVDPTSTSQGTNRVSIVSNYTGQLVVSDDNGSTFGPLWEGGHTTWTTPAAQPQWIAGANQGGTGNVFLSSVSHTIDPNGALWLGAGIAFYNSNQQAGDPPWVSLTTNAQTTSGAVLNFASVPASIRVGMRAIDPVNFKWAADTTVQSKTSTTVTLTNSVTSTVANGAKVLFSALPYYSVNTVDTTLMVVNFIAVAPNNSPITCQWDRGVSLIANPDTFATSQYPDNSIQSNTYGSVGAINGCWDIDYASLTSSFITAAMIGNAAPFGSTPAYSSDGGNSWNLWTALPTGYGSGAQVAASSSTNWVVTPAMGSAALYRTTNATSNPITWTASSFSGGTPAVFSPSGLNPINGIHTLAADRVTAGTFYAVDSSHQVWRSTDNGATFVFRNTVNLGDQQQNVQLKAVPNNAGHLLYTGGSIANTTGGLFKSTDGGGTWATTSSLLKDVIAFGLGAAKPGGSGYPVIYVFGWYNSVLGLYQSVDAGVTWTTLNVPSSQFSQPLDYPYQVDSMSGDMSVYGRVYSGFFTGSGAGYIDIADACPWVNFKPSTAKPNQAFTGTVTLTAEHSGRVPVTTVQFQVDGVNIGSAQTGQTTYSVSWNASGVTPGAHTLSVVTTGNGCSGTGSTFSIPITTS